MHRKFPNIFVGADAHLGPNVRTLPLHFAPSAAAVQTQRQYSTFKAPCKAPSNVWHAPQRPKQYGAYLESQETLVSCGVLWLLSFAEERKCPANFPPPKKTDGSESFRPFTYVAENQLPLYALAERADAGSGLLLAEHMDNPVQVGGVQPTRQREADEG